MSKQKTVLTVTSNYGLIRSQEELEFINVTLERDVEGFLNSFALKNSNNEYIQKMNLLLNLHFKQLLKFIRLGSMDKALELIEGFSEKECRGTHLGYANTPYGKGVGQDKAKLLLEAFVNSKAVQTGILQDIEETTLVISNVAYDTVSDIIFGICKIPFIEFTQNQAEKYNFATKPFNIKVLNHSGVWVMKQYELPYNINKPTDYIILTPKELFIHKEKLSNAKAYTYIWEKLRYFKGKELNLALIATLDDNILEKPLLKKEFKEKFPERKSFTVEFFNENPKELNMLVKKYNQLSSGIYNTDEEIAIAMKKFV